MPWYALSESGLIVRGLTPADSTSDLMSMLANTLEQAAKLEDDPEAAAHEAGAILYGKGILSTPPGSLKELLDLANADDHLWEWLAMSTEFPTPQIEDPDPQPDLRDLAMMA